ncbi:MAG: hypothetical protein ACJ75B_05920 [Flavisolibacter sp.]
MKNSIIFSFLTSVLLLAACRKSDNPKLPELTRFPTPLVTKVAGTDQVISAQNPGSFSGKFTVDVFFKTDAPPQKFDVVVIKNGDKSNVKSLQSNVTSFPTTITVTGTQLATLFGAPIVLGDKFDIGVDVTTNQGVKYEAFPVTGVSYASGVSSQPGTSTFVRYEAVCKYDPNQYQGNFIVVSDEWGDYAAGETTTITKIDATHFSFVYKADNPKPIIVTVDPNTNATSVAKQVYGSGYPPGWTFGDISAQSVPSVEDFVAPCQGTFSIVLRHTVAAGSFGNAKIVMKKE